MLCVFTTGQAWQFKPYKWTDPKDLFRNGKQCTTSIRGSPSVDRQLTVLLLRRLRYRTVLGIYFHLSTEPQHPATKDWNVKLFKVSSDTWPTLLLRLTVRDTEHTRRCRSTRNIDIQIDRSSALSGKLWNAPPAEVKLGGGGGVQDVAMGLVLVV